MVEAVVSVLFTKLIYIIENDALFHSDLKEEVRSLETELRWITHAVRHAKEKRRPSPGLEMWLVDLVNLSYDVEDVIDGYLPVSWIWICQKVKARRRFVKQVGQIKTRAKNLSAHRSVYATDEPDVIREAEVAEYIADRRRTVHADEIVGLHTEAARVEQWLERRGPERHVLSIIGMGGLGKTTLAGKIFKSGFVLGNFKTRVWVSVSQEYQLKEVFISVLKQLTGADSRFEKMDCEELEKEIYTKLKEERYLVVLDDLWEKRAWEHISVAFPKNGKGSRFILTSRNKEVAPGAEQDIMSLQLLNHEESWELFCRKMSFDGAVQSDLVEDLGRKIVKECCGLPLAIVVVAGLLRGRGLTQWPNVLKSITWWLFHSTTDSTSKCRIILLLSYIDLLDSLKSCFLFLGLFPEDFLISARKLKLLWIAEGFVQPRGGATMEDVADDYLEELAQRNLILVDAREYHGGPIENIRVHDLLRDLAITEARKYGFLDIQPNNEYTSSSETSISEFRRFALHSLQGQASLLHNKVRTILLFAGSLDIFKSTLNSNKMIRVLDLERVLIIYLPSVIGELVFLHYLGLRETSIMEVPDSLSKLERLQTLDIAGTHCVRLPNKIWRLKNLRHLFLGYKLRKLPRASGAVIESFCKNILTLELACDADFEYEPADFLVYFKSLKSLKVNGPLKIGSSIKERSYVENLSNCFPSTLTQLWLELSEFKGQEMDVLANLPELKALYLEGYSDMVGPQNDLIFPCGAFPQLQFLTLINLSMEKWLVADDAIPNLVHLSIRRCIYLLELPDRLKTLNIQQIDFWILPSMKDRHEENGEDWEKIKHIPIINYEE